jgi:hypothetical protein
MKRLFPKRLSPTRLVMAFAATALLAACGSVAADDPEVASLSTAPADDATVDTSAATGDATESTEPVDPSEAPLKFAQCMREHGIDMPDPTVSGDGGVMIAVGGPTQVDGGASVDGPDPEEFEAANKDCQHFMEDAIGQFDPPSEEDQKKMQEQSLEFAKCMRDHGVDMPDPQFSADGGGFSISIGGPADSNPNNDGPLIDFNSDEFKAASEACGGPGGGFAIATGPADG